MTESPALTSGAPNKSPHPLRGRTLGSLAQVATFVIALLLSQRVEAQESLSVSTLPTQTRGITECSWHANIDDRVPLARGRTSTIRVHQHFVDVTLKNAVIQGCSVCTISQTMQPSCEKKCNVVDVRSGVDHDMGFVEVDVLVSQTAPLGDATLSLKYPLNTRDYKLKVVAQAYIDEVSGVASEPGDQILIRGRNLGLLQPPMHFATVTRSDAEWRLESRISFCSNNDQANYWANLIADPRCRVRLPFFEVIRDADRCRPPLPTQPPFTGTNPRTTDILPGYINGSTFAFGPVIATIRGAMQQIPGNLCYRLASNVESLVQLPPFTWTVSVAGPLAAIDIPAQLIDHETGELLDTLILPAGEAYASRNNYPGRAATARVILNPSFTVGHGSTMYPGCFTAPGSNQTLDPRPLLIRVDPGDVVDEGTSGELNNDLFVY